MENYQIEERVFIVETYYESARSVTTTLRTIRRMRPEMVVPAESTIRRLIKKFKDTGSVADRPAPGPARSVRTDATVAVVQSSVNENPNTSVRRRAQEVAISSASLWRILTEDLRMFPYKVQLVQELKEIDHPSRREFVKIMLEAKVRDPDFFFKKIVFSDEAHFHLGGFVNRHNSRIWGSENPRVINERAQYPKKTTVWCALWSQGVIGPFFFENDNEFAVTVNGHRYREMIKNFFWPQLDSLDIGSDFWFQQDGATSHTAEETMTILQDRFPGHVISRGGDINWPSRSCDLTPLDFFSGDT